MEKKEDEDFDRKFSPNTRKKIQKLFQSPTNSEEDRLENFRTTDEQQFDDPLNWMNEVGIEPLTQQRLGQPDASNSIDHGCEQNLNRSVDQTAAGKLPLALMQQQPGTSREKRPRYTADSHSQEICETIAQGKLARKRQIDKSYRERVKKKKQKMESDLENLKAEFQEIKSNVEKLEEEKELLKNKLERITNKYKILKLEKLKRLKKMEDSFKIFGRNKKAVLNSSLSSGSDLDTRSRQFDADYPEELKETSSSDDKAATSRLRKLSPLQRKLSAKQKNGFIPHNFSSLNQRKISSSEVKEATSSLSMVSLLQRKQSAKQKYGFIPDNFSSLDQVTQALRDAGLESSNLILGIDFTKSNGWTGKKSFNNRSLHAIGDIENPYERAISVIGKTLAPLDDDNLIPCFGFGDVTTNDKEVFSFHNDHSPCHGFEEVLACYKNIVPNLQLSGPTSYGPVIDAAVDIVENSGGQFHVLVIVADGQVTRSVNTGDKELSSQEERTINSIVNASSHALSIVLVGVGDGPWEDMKKFDDKIPTRDFDNFQFVNFTDIMSKDKSPFEKETDFALAALMEIPLQYKATIELGLLGHQTGRAMKKLPCPPPLPYTSRPRGLDCEHIDNSTKACPICLTKARDLAFGCGHLACRECGSKVPNCPICRQRITSRLRLFA